MVRHPVLVRTTAGTGMAAEADIIGPDASEHLTDVSRDGQCRTASASRTADISGSLLQSDYVCQLRLSASIAASRIGS
jgi:hypothetical protein